MRIAKTQFITLLFFFPAFFYYGCSPPDSSPAHQNIPTSLTNNPILKKTKDPLMYNLEHAKISQDIGNYKDSIHYFSIASSIVDKSDFRPKFQVTKEISSIISDDRIRDCAGKHYSRILFEIYQAINYVAIENQEEALVHCRRGYMRQEESLIEREEYLKTIHTDEIHDSLKGLDAINYDFLPYLDSAYANLANPLLNYMSSLLLYRNNEKSNAYVDLIKVGQMVPQNKYIKEALRKHGMKIENNFVCVIFENGFSPRLKNLTLRLFRKKYTRENSRSNVYINIPELVFQDKHKRAEALLICATNGDELAKTEILASVEKMMTMEFKENMPWIIRRAIAGAIKESLPISYKGIKVGSTRADLRSWKSIGAEFQIAHITAPSNRKLHIYQIKDRKKAYSYEVILPKDKPSLILVRSTALSKMRIHLMKL